MRPMSQETVELTAGDVRARVVPERGALVSALAVGKTDVLFMDEATLADPAKNVRGGIPLLFPFAGKLVDELFVPAGTRMKQHGFARNKRWEVRERSGAAVRMGLVQDDDTRTQYPYAFDAEHRVALLPRGIQLELLVHNTGAVPLPVSPGWHPYFRCPAARKRELAGDLPGLDPAAFTDEREFDFGLEPPAQGRVSFGVPGLGTLRIHFSPAMRHLQMWSQPRKDFVCLEPFWGPNGTVNTEARCLIGPGRAQDFWMRLELD
jgi:galactose mutarotase-like enzyme